jgi:hypothetical protein
VLEGAFRFTTARQRERVQTRHHRAVATITAGIRGTDIWE